MPAVAVGEVVGDVVERLGAAPDLAVLFVTPHHVGALEDIAAAVQTLLDPTAFIGATAVAVLVGDRGVEDGPGLALWAGRLGRLGHARCTSRPTSREDGWHLDGLAGEALDRAGLARARRRPVHVPGQRGAPAPSVLPPRPAGDRWAGLGGPRPGGQPARHRRPGRRPTARSGSCSTARPARRPSCHRAAARSASPSPSPVPSARSSTSWPAGRRSSASGDGRGPRPGRARARPRRACMCGIVVDERNLDHERGDFLVRGLLGADRDAGALAVATRSRSGRPSSSRCATPATAGEDLAALLAGHEASGALVFTCNGRGTEMFGDAHHDATIVHGLLGGGRRRDVLRRRGRAHRRPQRPPRLHRVGGPVQVAGHRRPLRRADLARPGRTVRRTRARCPEGGSVRRQPGSLGRTSAAG